MRILRDCVAQLAIHEHASTRTRIRRISEERGKIAGEVTKALTKIAKGVLSNLDTHYINGKQLGDCTRTDLLKEASRLDGVMARASIDAGFYRALAEVVGDKTVRSLTGNDKIRGLLTSRFGPSD